MPGTPRILGLGTANPAQRYTQREIYDQSVRHFPRYAHPRIEQIFMNSDIDYRHFCLDLSTFVPDESADDLHSRFEEHSVVLGCLAAERCLADSGLGIADVDYIVAVTCTGYLCPGLSALFVKALGMRTDVQRADLVGMGCAGAMPGLQRAFEYVKAYPERRALVVTVEICSACYYVDDSLETVVGNAICADGAAAAVVGEGEAGPSLLRFETLLEPGYIDTVGFQFREGKLRIVLSKDIRKVAGDLAESLISRILRREGLGKDDVRHWIIHSGGRKVIDSIKEKSGLREEQLLSSRCVLRNFGNMSSPTVLFVLADVIRRGPPSPGDLGLLLAMGPGLAVEPALIRW